MSEEEQVLAILRLGGETTYYLLKGTVDGLLKLIRFLKKMEKEKMLSGQELRKFNSFLKVTEGNFQLLNVPTDDPDKLEEMRQTFAKTGVTYMVMPDLNPEDGMTQIAYYMPHTYQVEAWYRNFCLRELAGGEHSRAELRNLTEGRTAIVNIPWDKDLKLLREDFDRLGINYAVLPDLNVGDGYVQFLYAEADASKVRSWYEAYQKDFLKAGKWIDSFAPMTEDSYMNTGRIDSEEYLDGMSEQLAEQVGKEYMDETSAAKEERQQETSRRQVRSTADPRYLQLKARPGYLEISINESLVKNVNTDGIAKDFFLSRIPGTYGDKELDVMLPRKDVFTADQGKTFLTFLEANREYRTLTGDLRHAGPRFLGHELYRDHYASVTREFRKVRQVQPKSERKLV